MTTPLLSDSWSDSSTAETPVNTTERPLESFPLYIAGQYLRMIYVPLIFLIGMFGNVMIIVIMRRAVSGESAIHIYFIAIAAFDMVVLFITALGQWTRSTFGFDVSATHDVICKIYTWLYTGGGTINAWCLVCMTVHRAMSVVWPHRVNVLCTRRTVLLVLAGISIVFGLLYSHFMVGYERVYVASVNNYWCYVTNNYRYKAFLKNVFVYIDLALYCLLPFIFLLWSNSVLVWKLCVSVKEANRKLTQKHPEQVQSREKAASSVTLTVIVVSLTFVALTLPNSISFILTYFNRSHQTSGYEVAKTTFIGAVCNLLTITNSAVNFYLYILTGRRFREEFIKVMCCRRH